MYLYIIGEVLDWNCLDEDILESRFQEQIENDLEVVNKLKKKTCYFGELLLCSLLCEKSSVFIPLFFSFLNFNLPLLQSIME